LPLPRRQSTKCPWRSWPGPGRRRPPPACAQLARVVVQARRRRHRVADHRLGSRHDRLALVHRRVRHRQRRALRVGDRPLQRLPSRVPGLRLGQRGHRRAQAAHAFDHARRVLLEVLHIQPAAGLPDRAAIADEWDTAPARVVEAHRVVQHIAVVVEVLRVVQVGRFAVRGEEAPQQRVVGARVVVQQPGVVAALAGEVQAGLRDGVAATLGAEGESLA
jgi:hypothetical protein